MALRTDEYDLTLSASHGEAVTPSDTVDLAYVSRAIYVGGAGNLAVLLSGDAAAVTLIAVAVGSVLPLRVKRVMATNTTATNLVALS